MPPKKAHRKEGQRPRGGATSRTKNKKTAKLSRTASTSATPRSGSRQPLAAPLDLVNDSAVSVGSGSVGSVESEGIEVVAAAPGRPSCVQVMSDDDDSVIMFTVEGGEDSFNMADFADFEEDDASDPFVRFASDPDSKGQDLGALGYATRCPSCTVVVAIDADAAAQAAAAVDAAVCFETFRLRCRSCDAVFCAKCGTCPYHDEKTCDAAEERKHVTYTCRYCDANIAPIPEASAPTDVESPSQGKRKAPPPRGGKKRRTAKPRSAATLDYPIDCCGAEECRVVAAEHSGTCCGLVQGCGHPCYADCRDVCDLCLVQGCAAATGMNAMENTTAEDLCGICFTDELRYAPCAAYPCGHAFHAECIKDRLDARWPGHRITLDYMTCPLCGMSAVGPNGKVVGGRTLARLLKPHVAFRERVKQRVIARTRFEGVAADEAAGNNEEQLFKVGMRKLAFYECCKCKEPYFGGFRQCDVAAVADAGNGGADADREAAARDRDKLICGACSGGSDVKKCRTHGTDYIEYKCKFCCSLATFFCFGKTHFCTKCHDKWNTIIHDKSFPVCPATKGGRCPLGVPNHPPNGTADAVALGCALCRDKAQV